MNITILGAGAWGTALARLLHQGKNEVTLWGHNAEWLEEARRSRRNERFLPGIELPRELAVAGRLSLKLELGIPINKATDYKIYRLDGSVQLEPFAGKKVKVSGILDPKSQTLHIQKMEADR